MRNDDTYELALADISVNNWVISIHNSYINDLRLNKELCGIVSGTVEEVDTTGVPFTSNVNESINVMREDVATPGMDRKELMRNVPESENGYIKVPAIMDNGEAGA